MGRGRRGSGVGADCFIDTLVCFYIVVSGLMEGWMEKIDIYIDIMLLPSILRCL